MVDPISLLIATAVAAGSNVVGGAISNKKGKKASKLRSKETERETKAGVLNNASERNADLESHRISRRKKLGKKSADSMHDTADLVRGALSI